MPVRSKHYNVPTIYRLIMRECHKYILSVINLASTADADTEWSLFIILEKLL